MIRVGFMIHVGLGKCDEKFMIRVGFMIYGQCWFWLVMIIYGQCWFWLCDDNL